jgi:dienelactone hydrolase
VRRLMIFVCLWISAIAFAQDSFGPRLVQEEVRIPAGNGNYSIAATILRPDGRGPYGAVILNHGTPGSASGRAAESPELLIHSAAVFARRGYVVVLPLRRGFGATGGEFAEDPGTCANPDYRKGEQNAADDVMTAYDYARTLPYVDGNRMILAGQSAGGMVSMVAAGTRNPQGLVAVLSFAAGRGGNPDFKPGVPCAVEPVAKLLESVGRGVKAPVLLHYAENDLYFNAQTSRLWFERFASHGARAEYVLQPAFGRDGHYIFSESLGVRYWLPAVERFLSKHGVPFERLDAAAPIAAVDKLPYVRSDSCRNLYRAFLESPGPRAYAVSGDGRCGFAGGFAEASEAAVRECKANAKEPCALYAVDATVVYK